MAGEEDRKFYSDEIKYFATEEDRNNFKKHYKTVNSFALAVKPRILALDQTLGSLSILELGAGSCLTSLILRKILGRGSFTCFDISISRMHSLIESVAELTGSSAEGFNFVEGDFTEALPFDDQQFDLVIFDAALHHSRNIWTTLKEARRVVRPGGAVAALREAYLARFTYGYALRRNLRSPEVRAGVTENAYLREQYEYYFRACGFQPEFIPVYANWKWRILAPLNGLLMAKYNIWATR
jgi:ubiquinone/menaquinone biosynthesis C-methylase UbiE